MKIQMINKVIYHESYPFISPELKTKNQQNQRAAPHILHHWVGSLPLGIQGEEQELSSGLPGQNQPPFKG